jgi:hypothetical protein
MIKKCYACSVGFIISQLFSLSIRGRKITCPDNPMARIFVSLSLDAVDQSILIAKSQITAPLECIPPRRKENYSNSNSSILCTVLPLGSGPATALQTLHAAEEPAAT